MAELAEAFAQLCVSGLQTPLLCLGSSSHFIREAAAGWESHLQRRGEERCGPLDVAIPCARGAPWGTLCVEAQRPRKSISFCIREITPDLRLPWGGLLQTDFKHGLLFWLHQELRLYSQFLPVSELRKEDAIAIARKKCD